MFHSISDNDECKQWFIESPGGKDALHKLAVELSDTPENVEVKIVCGILKVGCQYDLNTLRQIGEWSLEPCTFIVPDVQFVKTVGQTWVQKIVFADGKALWRSG